MKPWRVKIAAGLGAGVMIATMVAGSASAATVSLYNNVNYSGGAGVTATSWYNANSTFNDAASSLKSNGTVTYYENIKWQGTHDTWTGNVSDLRTKPLRGENWNDRISSFK